ncbi:MAG: hypothetical protein LKK36_13020 [Ewingella americana]|jgi:hypothetical protein|uniref:hypothetical protein n=1 Tax=Ewingella americana TaxID=41202 RepID=UPI002430C97C|nr:hypothetical protein [Ewingella americana]MCI1680095.1 hypothetical protein [Ewingella americana]MCI1855090.1 hypothetical protein [Ewingella americana]MCI1863567.1 hypothetical protein [Ewingella americana]MCI2143437.1 hypothetical protein [Ewingella americana]MCI2164594.1 hypothetical protein [Ewingella americana]
MEMLERYYTSDKDWEEFSSLFSEYKGHEQVIELAVLLNENIDIATVIWGKVGRLGAKEWIYKNVNALDMARPVDCIDDKKLLNRLRVALMRMP